MNQTAFSKSDLRIDIKEYRLPTDKRTNEYKRMVSNIKSCVEANNSKYGYLSNLNADTIYTFFINVNFN